MRLSLQLETAGRRRPQATATSPPDPSSGAECTHPRTGDTPGVVSTAAGPVGAGQGGGRGLRMVVEGAIKFNSTGAKGVLLPWGLTH